MYIKRECTSSVIIFILLCFAMQSLILFYIIKSVISSNLRLEQVVILSRHGVRVPVSLRLNKMSPNQWPQWNENPGQLTARGIEVEGLLASYFSEWLIKNNILSPSCPNDKDFFAYADSSQRTIVSAEAFVEKAFPNCNVIVHYSSDTPDPIFNPVIHNGSVNFQKIAEKQMQVAINELKLNSSFIELNSILDYSESEYCKRENKCDLSQEHNTPYVRAKYKPKVSGGLKKSNEAIDGFLMALYNGLSEDQVAWGKLKNHSQWKVVMQIAEGYHDVVYKTESIAKDLAGPLLSYMRDIFVKKNTKVTLVMGHDSNINVVLNAMSFKRHNLRNSLASTPISGKVVFQKWFDENLGKYLLKVEYIYQSTDQIRNALPLSMEKPPEVCLMGIHKCRNDDRGFCLWDDFISILNDL